MTLQKDFLFALLPVAGLAFSYLWSRKNLCAFQPALSWLRNSGNFIFYSRHKFLSHRRLTFFDVDDWGRKRESQKANSISDINLLISIFIRLSRSFPFIKSRQPWTSPWKMYSIKRLVFSMIALDVASLNPFRCHKTTDNHFSVREIFPGLKTRSRKRVQIIILNSPLNVLWNDSSYRSAPPLHCYPQTPSLQILFLNFCRQQENFLNSADWNIERARKLSQFIAEWLYRWWDSEINMIWGFASSRLPLFDGKFEFGAEEQAKKKLCN